MELAKIRNKAQAESDRTAAGNVVAPIEEGSQPPALTIPDDLFDGPVMDVAFPGPAMKRAPSTSVRFDPVSLIVAGREADQAAVQKHISTENNAQFKTDGHDIYSEFLCFRLGNEEYGVSIMEIKEIIKPRELAEVPRAPEFVDGILSLRGVIVPVINMTRKLSLPREHVSPQERIVIVKKEDSLAGLRVDMVTGVVRILDRLRESTPAALDGIDREYVAGIGRTGDRIIILLDVQSVANLSMASGG